MKKTVKFSRSHEIAGDIDMGEFRETVLRWQKMKRKPYRLPDGITTAMQMLAGKIVTEFCYGKPHEYQKGHLDRDDLQQEVWITLHCELRKLDEKYNKYEWFDYLWKVGLRRAIRIKDTEVCKSLLKEDIERQANEEEDTVSGSDLITRWSEGKKEERAEQTRKGIERKRNNDK